MKRRIKICGPRRCKTIDAIVDSGATHTGISADLADELGLPFKGHVVVGTSNGRVRGGKSVAKVCLGGCGCVKEQITVLPEIDTVLLGEGFLRMSGARIDFKTGKITCRRSRGRR